jgi:hypothetical protein
MHPALVSAVATAQRCDQINQAAHVTEARRTRRGPLSRRFRHVRAGSGAGPRLAPPCSGLISAKL